MNDSVQFRVADNIFTGVIEHTNSARFTQNTYHSYDIFVENRGCSYAHIPEQDVLRKCG
ncbi:hypothetical protein [Enterococcus sp. AZ186]|uniref:hypothetical protein n=1 Tax=Enterococcus sp. AZ186 TaxID=2774632 RepID=UPI003F685146